MLKPSKVGGLAGVWINMGIHSPIAGSGFLCGILADEF
jgi:hypothetical protein